VRVDRANPSCQASCQRLRSKNLVLVWKTSTYSKLRLIVIFVKLIVSINSKKILIVLYSDAFLVFRTEMRKLHKYDKKEKRCSCGSVNKINVHRNTIDQRAKSIWERDLKVLK
jgi:hypothetical protein